MKLSHVQVPKGARHVLEKLHSAGFQAYPVGGCVRDAILGRVPGDWDMCTSAFPEEMQSIFSGYTTIESGLKHGTLGVVVDHQVYEITTYRVDGTYSDGRHPDTVSFSRNLREDLARRDFTINAMALGPDGQVIDYFHGLEDLRKKRLKAVGNPETRFQEDALRILRGIRFASVLGFSLETDTEAACRKLAERVRQVSAERIQVEFDKLLLGRYAPSVLETYRDVLETALGFAFSPMGELAEVGTLPENTPVRYAFLFGENLPAALKRLKIDNHRSKLAMSIVRAKSGLEGAKSSLEGMPSASEAELKFALRDYGEEAVDMALSLLKWEKDTLRNILWRGDCWKLSDLAIYGGDLTARGLKGAAVGDALQRALTMVILGECENSKELLLSALFTGSSDMVY